MSSSSSTRREFAFSWVVHGYQGIGKSTLMHRLTPLCNRWAGRPVVRLYEEDASEWDNYNGENLLENIFRAKQQRNTEEVWTSRLHMKVLLDQIEQDLEIRQHIPNKLCIQENDVRSSFHVFFPTHRDSLNRTDHHLLYDLASLGKDIDESNKRKTIFLYADRLIAYMRMCSGRFGNERNLNMKDYNDLCENANTLRASAAFALDTSYLKPEEVSARVSAFLATHA